MSEIVSRVELLKETFGDLAQDFEAYLKDMDRVQYEAYQQKVILAGPVEARLTDLSAKVPQFWSKALNASESISSFIAPCDKEALEALTNVQIVYGKDDVRNFDVVFTFAKNPFFSNTTLTKSYKVAADAEQYDLDAELTTVPTSIDWTSDEHNLVKKAPRVDLETLENDEDLDFEGNLGSFFCLFGEDTDKIEFAEPILEWYSHAVYFAAGIPVDEGWGSDDDVSDDSDDDAAEIDLDAKDK